MLGSFYSCDYDTSARSERSPFEFSAEMYAIADKYDAEALKEIVKLKFSQALENRKLVHDQVEDLVRAINIIYTTTPSSDRGLRNLLMPYFRQYRLDPRKDEGYMKLIASSL